MVKLQVVHCKAGRCVLVTKCVFRKSILQCERGTKKYDEVCVVDMCVYASLVDQRSVVFTECQCACVNKHAGARLH